MRVTAVRLPDGRVTVEIPDQGIGLTPEDFAVLNHKPVQPPAADAGAYQHRGLFVVGRPADRHGITVRLRPSGARSGTTCLVTPPATVTHRPPGSPPPPTPWP